ncbi:MAG: MucR family transcriptional regulator [Beijerinckiaceae bacterium]
MTNKMIELAADIVSAYVSKNSVPLAELSNVINSVHATLNQIASGITVAAAAPAGEPAVAIRKSVTPDFIICLEDGKQFKSLKRHLRTAYGMTPDQYRDKWGLKPDYPMVAPAYAKRRSALAKASGLGQQRRKTGKKA